MTSTQTGGSLDGPERRQCARSQVKSLAYLDIGADNGGIVLNISESGLAVHAVSVLPPDPVVDLRLQLPRSSQRLETKAKVVWTSGTKKEAGVEFIDLPENVRLEIKEWLALENLEAPYVAREKLRLQGQSTAEPSPTRRTGRTDKWTNLVSELMSIPAGIDRVVETPRASAPATVTEPTPVKETAALAPPRLDSILTSQESAVAAPARDFGFAKSLLTDDKQPNSEANSITALDSDSTDRTLSPNPKVNGTLQYSRSDREFSLPSDKLLSSPRPSVAIAPNPDDETENANVFRHPQETDSSAAYRDDFLNKAHELFGSGLLATTEQKAANVDAALILKPAAAVAAKLPAKDDPKEDTLPAPKSDLVATSALSGKASTPNAVWPLGSVPQKMDVQSEERKQSSMASPPARSSDPRSFVGLLALCVLLSVVCLALGIIVGRSVATRSPKAADSSHNASSQTAQTAPADVQNSTSSNEPAATATILHAQKQGQTQGQKQGLAREKRSPLEAPSRRAPTAFRSTDDAVVSSENDIDDPPQNAAADRPTVKNNSELSNGASTAAPPAVSVSASIAHNRATVPPGPNAAPRTPAPSDRLVAAYLIYRVEPFYPKEALQQRVEGTVRIHATVGQDGRVKNLRVVSGPASLTSAALNAAQYWRYVPALRNGEPVETDEDISIEFHLLH
jgi:TonB family protein